MEKRLCISSEIKNIQKVEKLIDELSGDFNLKSELYGNILISCIEAVNNAITHGNKLNKNKTVEIILKKEDNKLVVSISDDGNGFNPVIVPDPTMPDNIEKSNGRGLFIMTKLSDEINFFDGGKRVELIFNI